MEAFTTTCPWLLIAVAAVKTTLAGRLTKELRSVIPAPFGPVTKACPLKDPTTPGVVDTISDALFARRAEIVHACPVGARNKSVVIVRKASWDDLGFTRRNNDTPPNTA